MQKQKFKRHLAVLAATSLMVASAVPAGSVQAAAAEPNSNGNQMPVLATVPAAGAVTVRPDTKIELQLDTQDKFFKQWDKKFRDRELTLALINDGGQAVFSPEDSELTYNSETGKLSFTPPAALDRYTTYDVLITPEKLPDKLRQELNRKKLPQQPAPKVTAIGWDEVRATLQNAKEKTWQSEDLPSIVQQKPTLNELPSMYALSPEMEALLQKSQLQSQQAFDKTKQLAEPIENRWVGPKPVRPVDGANKAIDFKNGSLQTGLIKTIEGRTITLFGGTQFTVDDDSHIQIPGAGKSTLADLKPGTSVNVTVNAKSDVQNVIVQDRKDVLSFVFKTGSALHEPTRVELEQKVDNPRVTEDGHLTLVSTDDYGLPAWGSETTVELSTEDGSPLDSSANVLPSRSFTTANQSGRTDITVVDHKPQRVLAKISLNGPHTDGYNAFGFIAAFTFRPGLAETATLTAPETVEVGTTVALNGHVQDQYGNAVEEGSAINLSATAGTVSSPVYTTGGEFQASYTAPTATGDAMISLASVQGTAKASAAVKVLPGEPSAMTFNAPATLPAGESTQLTGSVTDRYGNKVLDGSDLIFSATAGNIEAASVTSGGAFSIRYTAPEKVQQVNVAAASGKGSAAADRLITIVPNVPADLSLQAAKTNLLTSETTALNGQVADKYGNLIAGQAVALTAEHGALSEASPATDASGSYQSVYTAPFYNGTDHLAARAGAAQAALDLNISSAGSGIDPSGAVKPVASIQFEKASYTASPDQLVTLTGHVYDAAGQPLHDVLFNGQSATVGTIVNYSYQTDATGTFKVTYRAPKSQASATVTMTSGPKSGSTVVNTLAYGYGYNTATGAWEPVGTIEIESARYSLNKSYNITIFPGQAVEFTGHAYNATKQPLSSVLFDKATATAGTLNASAASDDSGAFTLRYTAPTTESNQILQLGSGNVLTTINAAISTYGYGYNQTTKVWEAVAKIVYNPSTYSATASGTVTLTGYVTNAAGTKLAFARVNTSATGGTVTNQIVSGADGNFSMTYIAPGTAGTYTVRGAVNTVYGDAVINVAPPKPAYYSSANITVYGTTYSIYFNGTVYWGGCACRGDGSPMSYGDGVPFQLSSWANLAYPAYTVANSAGCFDGPSQYTTGKGYVSDRGGRGYTTTVFLYYQLNRYDGDHYQGPLYDRSYTLHDYVY